MVGDEMDKKGIDFTFNVEHLVVKNGFNSNGGGDHKYILLNEMRCV